MGLQEFGNLNLEIQVGTENQRLKKYNDVNSRYQGTNGSRVPLDPRTKRKVNYSDTSFRESHIPRFIPAPSQKQIIINHWSATNILPSASKRKRNMRDVSNLWEAIRTNLTKNKETIGDFKVVPDGCSEEIEYATTSAHRDDSPSENFRRVLHGEQNKADTANCFPTNTSSSTSSCIKNESKSKSEHHLIKTNLHQHDSVYQENDGKVRKSKSRQINLKGFQNIASPYKCIKYKNNRKKRRPNCDETDCGKGGQGDSSDNLCIKNDFIPITPSIRCSLSSLLKRFNRSYTASNFVVLIPVFVMFLAVYWLYQELITEKQSCSWSQCPYEATTSLIANHMDTMKNEIYEFFALLRNTGRSCRDDKMYGWKTKFHNFWKFHLRR